MASNLKDTAPFSAEDLKDIINSLNRYNSLMWNKAQNDGRLDYAIQYNEVVQTFVEGIYFVWERYGFGWADELADENGVDGCRYMLFQMGVEERVEGLLNALRLQNIFGMFEGGNETRNLLIMVYADLLRNLKSGRITF